MNRLTISILQHVQRAPPCKLKMFRQLAPRRSPAFLTSPPYHPRPIPFSCAFTSVSPVRPKFTHRRSPARLVPALIRCTADDDIDSVPLASKSTPAKPLSTAAHQIEQGEDGLPRINEGDLEEQFVRGSGPGGQKINKTASCVVCIIKLVLVLFVVTQAPS